MESDSYKYFNKWFVQFSSNNSIREIKSIATVNIEIKIMKDMIHMFEKSFQKKQVQLNDTEVELNNFIQEIWIRRNASCCQVWNFSYDHNFLSIFENYPYIRNPIKFHNCQYNTTSSTIDGNIKTECIDRADAQNKEYVQKLEKEIVTLKEEINTVITSQNAEITIQKFSIKLRRLKQFSEEIMKLLKFIYNNENLDDQEFNKNSKVLECKNKNLLNNANRNNMLTFTKAKMLIGQYNSHSHILNEQNNIPRMMMENSSTSEYHVTNTKKQFKNKFSVKTQSSILIKFEQERCLKKKEN